MPHQGKRHPVCAPKENDILGGVTFARFMATFSAITLFFSLLLSSSDSRFDIPTSRKPSSISDIPSEMVIIMWRREQVLNMVRGYGVHGVQMWLIMELLVSDISCEHYLVDGPCL